MSQSTRDLIKGPLAVWLTAGFSFVCMSLIAVLTYFAKQSYEKLDKVNYEFGRFQDRVEGKFMLIEERLGSLNRGQTDMKNDMERIRQKMN